MRRDDFGLFKNTKINLKKVLTPPHFSVIMYKHLRKVRHSSLAQSVEHSAVNRVVVGSSPTRGATKTTQKCVVFSFVLDL